MEALLSAWISDTAKLHANMATRSKVSSRALLSVATHWSTFSCRLQLSQFDDLIDDLLLRTEEFEHLLELVSSDASACLFKQVPVLQEHFSRMEEAFAGVERLEAMVAAVREDVERTERLVAQAEDTVEANGIRAYIPNLFVSSCGRDCTLNCANTHSF